MWWQIGTLRTNKRVIFTWVTLSSAYSFGGRGRAEEMVVAAVVAVVVDGGRKGGREGGKSARR